ncbi:glycerol-3-phosphate responsive antiterminator [Paenibacillus albiflavus]|uniref:Glycerol uptake operon antiterminator regulatory protein n=1 Tax=Paenibacillus albiflavus TaxID=2545760 RepID=A0A4R4EFX0_9BACL|nr:glycerol-3-phosphate responsive antiterminator [Paenibacillus albiflavus]TCZ78976.1 glycerol-3-phosphate responsive antiterminator [Paenibacillus albiflavus]
MKSKSESYDRLAYCLKRKPVITSLVNKEELPTILQSTSNIVFVLKADIFSIEPIVEQIREAGKLSFIHFDLIDGIGKDKMGVAYMAEKIGIDGIVTTKSSIISEGKKHGLMTIQRLFVFDSVSLDNGIKITQSSQPDAIEVLPGMVCTRIIKRIHDELDVPVIAGGLMVDLSDLELALKSGAIGISTSSKELWDWQDANVSPT